jgi:hypothetical protein
MSKSRRVSKAEPTKDVPFGKLVESTPRVLMYKCKHCGEDKACFSKRWPGGRYGYECLGCRKRFVAGMIPMAPANDIRQVVSRSDEVCDMCGRVNEFVQESGMRQHPTVAVATGYCKCGHRVTITRRMLARE